MKNNPELSSLKRLRVSEKRTIEKVAKSSSISKSLYSCLEKGQKRLSYSQAVKIAKAFKTTPDKIFLKDFREFFRKTPI